MMLLIDWREGCFYAVKGGVVCSERGCLCSGGGCTQGLELGTADSHPGSASLQRRCHGGSR